MTATNINEQVLAQPATEPAASRPLRRSFLTGKVLDPELHPSLRTRIGQALRLR